MGLSVDQAYEVLGLESGSSFEEIKDARRQLTQIYHPDRFSGRGKLQDVAEERMRRVNEAYEVAVEHARRTSSQPSGPKSSSSQSSRADNSRERAIRNEIHETQSAVLLVRSYLEQANRSLMWGAVWLIGGLGLTALARGSVLFWGAIIFGGWKLVKSLSAATQMQAEINRLHAYENKLEQELLNVDGRGHRQASEPRTASRSASHQAQRPSRDTQRPRNPYASQIAEALDRMKKAGEPYSADSLLEVAALWSAAYAETGVASYKEKAVAAYLDACETDRGEVKMALYWETYDLTAIADDPRVAEPSVRETAERETQNHTSARGPTSAADAELAELTERMQTTGEPYDVEDLLAIAALWAKKWSLSGSDSHRRKALLAVKKAAATDAGRVSAAFFFEEIDLKGLEADPEFMAQG